MENDNQLPSARDTSPTFDLYAPAPVLLDQLRQAWHMPPGRPIKVVGRLHARRSSGERPLYFLEGLQHAETGAELRYPDDRTGGAAKAYVPVLDAEHFDAGPRPWLLAELELSPLEHRSRHFNAHECVTRRGSLQPLVALPPEWAITLSGRQPIRLVSEMAWETLHEQHVQLQAVLETEARATERQRQVRIDALTAERDRVTAERDEARKAADTARGLRDEQEHALRLLRQVLTKEEDEMKRRLQKLSELMAERGQRLQAMGLLDAEDLEALLPATTAAPSAPAHDFEALLAGDYARIAPFVQARLWRQGMLFTQSQLRDFLALLRTHDMVVLAGDSGAGKTSLVRCLADSVGGRCTVVPVKPNWTGPEDLLGYYNPLERSYQSTPFLQALQAAQAEPEVPHFICLDEMNLARVEHYFADFLSLLEERGEPPLIPLHAADEERHAVMESGLFLTIEAEARTRLGLPETATIEDLLCDEQANALLHKLGGFKDAESVLLHHGRLRRSLSASARTPTALRFPANVRIIGAVNVDDTTHYLSPKVLDRVHVLRFRNPVLVDWDMVEAELEPFDEAALAQPLRLTASVFGERQPYPPFDRQDPDASFLAAVAREQLDGLGVEFGMRAIRQSLHYLRQAQATGVGSEAALNNVILHKVLPKLMLDLGRSSHDGRSRRDILVALRERLAARLDGLEPMDVTESCVEALDRILAAADGNNGIANYWLR